MYTDKAMMFSPFEANLHQQLDSFFSEHGYTFLADKNQFRRVTASGFQYVVLSPTLHPVEAVVDVYAGGRHEQIEQIAQQFINNTPNSRPDATTIHVSMGRFSAVRDVRYQVQLDAQLTVVCDQITGFFSTQGFEFLASASLLPTLDHLLNEQSTKPSPYLYNQIHRCYKGLIAARLNHNPGFNNLVNQYRHLLSHLTQNAHEQLHFERLIAYLHYYSAN